MNKPFAHIVLVHPEIPWNTGNAGRSCLAFGARLHLVEPLGFLTDDKSVRRAGLDYWKDVDLTLHPSWEALQQTLDAHVRAWLITPEGDRAIWEVELDEAPSMGHSPVLVFGRESAGLPPEIRTGRLRDRRLSIPTPGPVRSLNVSTTVGVVLAELARQRSAPAMAKL